MGSHIKIVLVGGGTGGHFYPLISVAQALRSMQPVPDLYYMGPDPYDTNALVANHITFVRCPAGKWRRYASLENVLDIFRTCVGVFVAILKLFAIYPDAILSKGGYTSFPVIFAARLLRIPIIVHESDAVPGRANRYASKFARYVAVSYEEVRTKFPKNNTVLTGIPIRQELLSAPRTEARRLFGITTDLPVILVLGGSLGALRVNELILDSLDELLPRYEIIHQTGQAHFEVTKLTADELITDQEHVNRYHPVAFLDAATLNDALHTASLVISRAGSTSIHEIAVHAKPSILIPIPEDISHDQRTNAYAYARATGATVMEEANMKDGLLVPEIDRIMQDQATYAALSTAAEQFAVRNAAEELAQLTLKLAIEH